MDVNGNGSKIININTKLKWQNLYINIKCVHKCNYRGNRLGNILEQYNDDPDKVKRNAI